MGTLIGS